MNINEIKPRKALNKSFLKTKPVKSRIELFKKNLIELIDRIDEKETEEFHKNLVADFLKNTYYSPYYFINTKGRSDLVIHNGNSSKSSIGVIIETKKPTNTTEMLSKNNINVKAFQELILYYLRERITLKNLEIKYLIATNIYEWYIFNANIFEKLFAQNKKLVNHFTDFENSRLTGKTTDFFYKEIASPLIEEINEIEFTYFDIRDYKNYLQKHSKENDNKLIALYKLLSPEHILKLPFANDNNTLDKDFYKELLHIIGLTEVTKGSKKLIQRKEESERNSGSLLENTIIQLDSLDKISRLSNPSLFGSTLNERLFNVALELNITWINRILFLKLLEAQLISYHKGDKSYSFLNNKKIKNYDDLNSLFFQVLARKYSDRNDDIKEEFEKTPYLNSSLFEPTEIEHSAIFISNLRDDKTTPIYSSTVLKDEKGKKKKGEMTTLEYLFAFLDAYDFSSEGAEEIQEDNRSLINASVLGLIFEKINGYKDGSFFTPGFITMYMSKETIRRAVIQKFNEIKGWNCNNIDDLYDKIEDRQEANEIINSLKIVDPAVGSGHFLVSALNEIIAIKSDLRILQDRQGRRLKEYQVEVINDELIITDEDGALIEYNPNNKESQRIQEALFHEKQTIIENCLFGVDINPNSVKICRLRLWIELLKNAYYKNDIELETLPNIDINIKCGNSLISRFDLYADLGKALKKSNWTIDSYRIAVDTYRNAQTKEQKHAMEKLINDIKGDFKSEISMNDPKVKRLTKLKGELFMMTQPKMFELSKKEKEAWNKKLKELTKKTTKLEKEIEEIKNNKIFENAFEWRFEFPEVLDDNGDFIGFDVAIGNPPYIQLSKIPDTPKEEKNYLINKYKTSGGRLNTFIFFTHLGGNILKQNGILHYIIPNTILSQEYYNFTRNYLINKMTLTEIVNFDKLPFEDAVVETVLIQYLNKTNQNYSIPIKQLTKKNVKIVSSIKSTTINSNSNYSLVYSLDPIIEKIYSKDNYIFGNICNINQGIALKGDKSLSLKTKKENDNCFKVLDGKNINKYSINWGGIYIDYNLERIHSCKTKTIFETNEKLFFRRVSSSLIFAYDNSQYFSLNTLVVVNKKNDVVCPNLKYILGLMNSKLLNYIYLKKFKSTKKVFSEIQAKSVKQLPVLKVNENTQQKIIYLVDKIVEIKNNNYDANVSNLINEIDKIVYKLYNLTDDEIKIIENEKRK